MDREIWKDVIGYEGLYQVSNLGRVRRFLKTKKCKICNFVKQNGYLYCKLSKNNKQKKFRVHRIVAFSFISNPNNYKEINHINCDKCDNRVINLEWCNSSQNKIHAIKHGLCKKIKPVLQIKNGKIINIFENIHDASIKTNFERTSINKCILGKRKKCLWLSMEISIRKGGYLPPLFLK